MMECEAKMGSKTTVDSAEREDYGMHEKGLAAHHATNLLLVYFMHIAY
jgi:hypothetical protein